MKAAEGRDVPPYQHSRAYSATRHGHELGLTRKESTSMSDDGLHYAQSK
jgi:hypothetical protein